MTVLQCTLDEAYLNRSLLWLVNLCKEDNHEREYEDTESDHERWSSVRDSCILRDLTDEGTHDDVYRYGC